MHIQQGSVSPFFVAVFWVERGVSWEEGGNVGEEVFEVLASGQDRLVGVEGWKMGYQGCGFDSSWESPGGVGLKAVTRRVVEWE